MKTSNKILIGLIVVVFAVPFLLAYSLKSKMQKGEYTVKKNENAESRGSLRSGSFTAFKVVKVVAPTRDFLTCYLKKSDTMNYRYHNYDSKDSVLVYTSNDTLYIQYWSRNSNANPDQRRAYNHFEINVDLPDFTNLVVDGAVVVLDSPGTISVSLKNNGEVKEAGKTMERESGKVSPAVPKNEQMVKVTTIDKTIVRSGDDKGKVRSLQQVGIKIPDVDIKELMIYGLFYRI